MILNQMNNEYHILSNTLVPNEIMTKTSIMQHEL